MRAHILSIGSELILGHLTDSNATFLAQELVGQGIELLHVTQVSDELPRMVATLRAAAAEADLIICTGGVGPTADDLTREAIAELAGETPEVDPSLLEEIRSFFAGRGLTMPERNAKQAWMIPSAEALLNPVGTAPGWFVRHDNTLIAAMPGVPREMYRMWREQVVPRLAPLLPKRAVRSITFKTLGVGESAVAEMLADLIDREQPIVATYAKDDGVQVRVTAVAPTESEAMASLNAAASQIREDIGGFLYAEDDRPLAAVLADQLREQSLTLGVAELGTGGRFGSLLLSEPEVGDVVLGAIAHADATGSAPDAATVAESARSQFGSGLGLGMVAKLSPTTGGLHEGLITVAIVGDRAAEESFPLRGAFAEIQRRASLSAADVLRRTVGARVSKRG